MSELVVIGFVSGLVLNPGYLPVFQPLSTPEAQRIVDVGRSRVPSAPCVGLAKSPALLVAYEQGGGCAADDIYSH